MNRSMQHENHLYTLLNGITGILGSVFAYTATLVQELTAWMQFFSFVAGFSVSVLMFIKMWRDMKKKDK